MSKMGPPPKQRCVELLTEFLAHYDARKITNGFHDLLARKVRRYLKELNKPKDKIEEAWRKNR